MKLSRRTLITGAGAIAVASVGGMALSQRGTLQPTDTTGLPKLRMPSVIDATKSGRLNLTAMTGSSRFFGTANSRTIGFNQPYLGPVVQLRNGPLDVKIQNDLGIPITVHWHGLMVPGEHDGGPHSVILPGRQWRSDMQIAQSSNTAFFHTHVHGRTAQDVYSGLAGIIHVKDDQDDERGLPTTYGTDDITLVLQDRRFDAAGRMIYGPSMMDRMHGFLGDTMLVNGQVGAVAAVPKGIVRLRLVNASNARIFRLSAHDDRPLHLIATDGGYLPSPTAVQSLRLSPGERAELLIDFSSGYPMTLISDGDPNSGPGGMMGRFRGLMDTFADRRFPVVPFVVDEQIPVRISELPVQLGAYLPDLGGQEMRTRRFSLDMGMGGMMGRGMMGGGMMGGFAINGEPFDMTRINLSAERGTTERWIVSTNMLTHPFHIHGAFFQVVTENGQLPHTENVGWKDTVVVDGESELLVRFDHPAGRQAPYMYHCHILEHEDGGMMGQFTVT